MSKFYTAPTGDGNFFGVARRDFRKNGQGALQLRALKDNFDEATLFYLNENVINHLFDSSSIRTFASQFKSHFNDYSFYTAPAYKAFEGFLFQLAIDLKLPSSGNKDFVGTYFDENLVDKTIDSLLSELENKLEENNKMTNQEKTHIKDMVKEMKRFLVNYRHTPAHFHGEPLETIEKAEQNVLSMYRIIDETVKTLLKVGLITLKENLH